MTLAIKTIETPRGILAIATGSARGHTFEHAELVPYSAAGVGYYGEVGAFGDRLKSLARSKVVRGLAKATGKVLRALPYTSQAMAAVDVAREAAQALRGRRRGSSSSSSSSSSPRGSSNSSRRSSSARARPRDGGGPRIRPVGPNASRLELAQQIIADQRMNDRAKVSALAVLLGVELRRR